MTQDNTTIQPDVDPRLYEIGQPLRFIGYAKDEAWSMEGRDDGFTVGDLLKPIEQNGCGMGIDVQRADGRTDMVWPDEVVLA